MGNTVSQPDKSFSLARSTDLRQIEATRWKKTHHIIVHIASQNPYEHEIQSPHGDQLQKTSSHEEPEQ